MMRYVSANSAAMLVWLALAVPAAAQRELEDVPAPNPELERASFQVADGFEVNLYAADPLLAKPIQMNFDPAGRLWVAASRSIRKSSRARRPTTRSSSSKTADGDGRAEKTTRLRRRPVDPDRRRAGRRRRVRWQQHRAAAPAATPTATAKPIHGGSCFPVSAPRTRITSSTRCAGAPTACLYFNQSVYIHSHIETPYGVRRLGGGGIWQFRPETMRLEVFSKGLVERLGTSLRPLGPIVGHRRRRRRGNQLRLPGVSYPASPGAAASCTA